ncbi:GNAT family N-acetyltransferase [Variovorax sp. RTB1]|uniref:GNAT family N-acetyltransferase n=1 Tax=Variovorax sp. RTB1 TaxID=3048631 RepID=UPI002B23AEB5|nr:GNAT family N-acetyltransferase [Variovorax sp. RTB1]MEB0113536.1 GNAT family N-acetyltransferase [Variovorax sp. RTB1]
MNDQGTYFESATSDDVEALVELRILAMRESLERIGRFDPQRARERFVAGFEPKNTRHLMRGGERIGFVVVRREPDHHLLDHLYIHPNFQGRGYGAAVLGDLFAEADATGALMRVGALRGSDSNRFYARHGFELVEQAEWDNYYLRKAKD